MVLLGKIIDGKPKIVAIIGNFMHTHNLPVTALFCLTFGVIFGIKGVSKCESSV